MHEFFNSQTILTTIGIELQNTTGEVLGREGGGNEHFDHTLGIKTCFRVQIVDEFGRVPFRTVVQYETDSNQIWHVASEVSADFEALSEVFPD
jgi:hypothetical protein